MLKVSLNVGHDKKSVFRILRAAVLQNQIVHSLVCLHETGKSSGTSIAVIQRGRLSE